MNTRNALQLDLEVGKLYWNGFGWFEYVDRVNEGPENIRRYVFKGPKGGMVTLSTWDVNINFADPRTSYQKRMSEQ